MDCIIRRALKSLHDLVDVALDLIRFFPLESSSSSTELLSTGTAANYINDQLRTTNALPRF